MVPQKAQYRHKDQRITVLAGVGSLWPNTAMPVLAQFFADVQELMI